MEMTKSVLRDICTQNKLYRTPHLNEKLYLNFKGFTQIASLEEYTSLKALFLEGNALTSLEGMPRLEDMKCLYVQQNCIRSLDGLEQLPNLNTLNVSSNSLTSLQNLESCPQLSTCIAERNHLSTAAGLRPLLQCTSLHTLDLQHNSIEDTAVIDILVQMPQLRCLYLAGNPVVSKIPSYRKFMIARCSQLTYLDDRPVTEEERLWCQAWSEGGLEAERAERARQKEEEKAKDRRNFEWLQQLRHEGFRKRRAMLGLPDGDTDPFFDTLPDQESRATRSTTGAGPTAGRLGSVSPDEDSSSAEEGDISDESSSEVEELLQDPPELVAACRRLEEYRNQHAGNDSQPHSSADTSSTPGAAAADPLASAGSADDGAVYLASVKAAQQELDSAAAGGPAAAAAAAAAAAPSSTPSHTVRTGSTWPGPAPSTGVASKLASMRAATQAALAAVGLAADTQGSSTAHGISIIISSSGELESAAGAAQEVPAEQRTAPAAERLQEEPAAQLVTTQDSTVAEAEVPKAAAAATDATAGTDAAAEVAVVPSGPRGFDLGLVNSWSSAATDRTSDADQDGSSSPADAGGSPTAAADEAGMQRSKPSSGSSSSPKGSPTTALVPNSAAADPGAACACVEDVVVQVAGAGGATGTSAVDLYELD